MLKFEVCPECEGHGTSSAHLGSFTASEFAEQFDEDEARDYFAGAYDRKCEYCNGDRVVKVPGCEITGETLRERQNSMDTMCEPCAEMHAQWEMEAERRAEMRMGA